MMHRVHGAGDPNVCLNQSLRTQEVAATSKTGVSQFVVPGVPEPDHFRSYLLFMAFHRFNDVQHRITPLPSDNASKLPKY